MRMRELERRSGVGRETIRFYIREGLLPEPERPKRNVASYGEAHVVRLAAIRRLQEERFLPLSVIKALINSDGGARSIDAGAFPGIDALLSARIDGAQPQPVKPLDQCAAACGLTPDELQEMAENGLIIPRDGGLDARDQAIALRWARLREAGISPERGFKPEESRIYAEFVTWLAKEEVRLFYAHMADEVDTEEALRAAEGGVTLINEIIGLMRTRAILTELKALSAAAAARRAGDQTTSPDGENQHGV